MKENFKIAAVFIGTIVGAGLASGQEILQFFSLYGINSYFGILICLCLYVFSSFIIVKICITHSIKSYRELINFSLGKKIGAFVNAIMTFFIYGSCVIMISGGGAMLHEYLGIKAFWGAFLMAITVILVSLYSTNGIIAVNSSIVPFSTLTIIVLGILLVIKCPTLSIVMNGIKVSTPIRKMWFSSSIIYSCMNILSVCGVLCPMIYEFKDKKHFIKGCTYGSVVLVMLMLIINTCILAFSPESFNNEIPNLYISRNLSLILPAFLTTAIFLEMLSTGISDVYSLSKMLHYSYNLSYTYSTVLIILSCIPFSFLGFSKLISILYPANGVLGVIFLAACMCRYFRIAKINN